MVVDVGQSHAIHFVELPEGVGTVARTLKTMDGSDDQCVVLGQEAIAIRIDRDWIVLRQEDFDGNVREILVRPDYLRWLIEGLESFEKSLLNK